MRFGTDIRVATLLTRSAALRALGYLEGGLADAEDALSSARAMGHAPTLLWALSTIEKLHLSLGNYAAANAALDELGALARRKRRVRLENSRNYGARAVICLNRANPRRQFRC